MSNLLDQLNPAQREAVTATDGPVLVVAGAGSGKTRVITYRIAYLIEQGLAQADEILAVTFTNKAADVLRQRVEGLVPGARSTSPWTSTFHSFCARLLRREAAAAGLSPDFSIYDDDDQERLARALLKEAGEDDRTWQARSLLERVSRAKTAGRAPDDWERSENPLERRQADLYRRYQESLRAARALDFDDLLLEAVRALAERPEVRARCQRRFRYLHVDEFQDTNLPQYALVRLLAPPDAERQNVCVVGDEDQSIYAWRGAEVANFRRFEQDYPNRKLVLLEENYRSTQPILDAATAVIRHNTARTEKALRSERKQGPKAQLFEAPDAPAEARYAAERLWAYRRQDPGAKLAVLYRTNAQSRLFEEALRGYGLPYRVVGGFSFYKRAEVRDLLAYARAARNPADEQALLEIINVPPRKIGPVTVRELQEQARTQGLLLWDAIATSSMDALREFVKLINRIRDALDSRPLPEALAFILSESGYQAWLEEQKSEEAEGRLENVQELIAAAEESAGRGETPAEFLDRAALVSDADDYDAAAPITLMTLHSAKGTEFDVVFLAGLEDGLLPHSRALERAEDPATERGAGLEEERRLCYVGMTRARNELHLLRALRRRSWGAGAAGETDPSRFLLEIPEELLERIGGPALAARAAGDGGWTYEIDAETKSYLRRGPRRESRRRRSEDEEAIPVHRRQADSRYPAGCTVRHPKFGEGTVLDVDGTGADRKLLIHFARYGRKKLVEKYADLERL
jgi:DNA helicase-2/ATP-dependent DNA helicase PcrA